MKFVKLLRKRSVSRHRKSVGFLKREGDRRNLVHRNAPLLRRRQRRRKADDFVLPIEQSLDRFVHDTCHPVATVLHRGVEEGDFHRTSFSASWYSIFTTL